MRAARRRVRNGYRSEVGFYRDIASTVDVATPRCWYAAITDDSLAFTLLLDDLSPRVPGVQAAGCTIEQARLAVANLAALHAGRWNDESDLRSAVRGAPDAGRCGVPRLGGGRGDRHVRRAVRRATSTRPTSRHSVRLPT